LTENIALLLMGDLIRDDSECNIYYHWCE